MDLDVLSFQFFGWTYLIAWTVLYYPQIRLNFRKKSCAGVSKVYVIYNTFGFACYTLYNVARKVIQDQNDLPAAVSYHDVLFAIHSLACCICICLQLLWYEKGNETISQFDWLMLLVLIIITILAFLMAGFGMIDWATTDGFSCRVDCSPLRQLSFIQIVGYVKVVVTLLKYPTQIKLNYVRKTTQGLSRGSYLLDMIGGICSVLQNVMHAILKNDMEYIEGNFPKLGLGGLSFAYDVIILCQIRYYAVDRKYIRIEPAEEEGEDDFAEFRIDARRRTRSSAISIESTTVGIQMDAI